MKIAISSTAVWVRTRFAFGSFITIEVLAAVIFFFLLFRVRLHCLCSQCLSLSARMDFFICVGRLMSPLVFFFFLQRRWGRRFERVVSYSASEESAVHCCFRSRLLDRCRLFVRALSCMHFYERTSLRAFACFHFLFIGHRFSTKFFFLPLYSATHFYVDVSFCNAWRDLWPRKFNFVS